MVDISISFKMSNSKTISLDIQLWSKTLLTGDSSSSSKKEKDLLARHDCSSSRLPARLLTPD